MKPVSLLIERYSHEEKQTIGNMFALNEDKGVVKQFVCLELPWKDNKPRISCIPTRVYEVKRRWSKKFGWHFHVTDVEGRSYILIHKGNFHTQILGCILPGMELAYINDDACIDVKSSGTALQWLLDNMPEEFELTIKNV